MVSRQRLHLVVPTLLQAVPHCGSALSLPEALGVVGVVLPDSSPLLSMVTLLGAAVATGNAIIMVPSQKYPLPALAFIQVSLKTLNVPENTCVQLSMYLQTL